MIPKEDYEIECLANWLRANGYMFNNIMNETDFHSIAKGAKRKRMGVNKGFPDFCISLLQKPALLFIEMKRQRKILKSGKLGASPSVVSEEQKIWIEELNKIPNVQAEICYGASDAINIIKTLESK